MRGVATVAAMAIGAMAAVIGWVSGAEAGARDTFEDALNRSAVCKSLPRLNVCVLAEAANMKIDAPCGQVPSTALLDRFDGNAHKMRYEDRFAYAVNGRLFVTFELACRAGPKGSAPNMRYAEDVSCNASISSDCTATSIACSPTNDEGPMFAAFDDLEAAMKAPLEAAAAQTPLCE